MKSIFSESLFIKQLTKKLKTKSDDIIVGIGDDAAVLKQQDGMYLLATVDCQVEDVHFRREHMSALHIGQKAVMAAISDIAAMGGTPRHLLTSLVIAPQTDASYIDKLYEGIQKVCNRYHIALVGGNISKGRQLVIDVTCLGVVKPDELLRRLGAKAGDSVLLTGKLGDSLVPRIPEGRAIAQSRLATGMIDISDGLSTDLLHLCEQSGVGVRIFSGQLPISSSFRHAEFISASHEIQKQVQDDTVDMALNGGEDYELCFTVNAKDAKKLIARVKHETGTDVTIIGEIIAKKEGRWLVDGDGKKKKLVSKGWNHFL